MKELLVQTVKNFLSAQLKKEGPVLLGFSGGVDSAALCSLLLECHFFFSFDLHLVHFDHAWRSESAEEALLLQEKAKSFGCSFHTKRSKNLRKEGRNKEEEARKERYQFFKEIYTATRAQSLILAHQRDDQAETVLKRILEGASLSSMGGMQPVSLFEEMVVWRPLLSSPRKSLVEWNEKKGISPLKDITNLDLQFLRPRMREKIFPELESWFGKNVQKSLAHLGEELVSLKGFLHKKRAELLVTKKEGRLGFFWPVQGDPLEIEEAIRFLSKEKGEFLSREEIKRAGSLLQEGVLNKEIKLKKGELLVDGGRLFWFDQPLPIFTGKRQELGWRWTCETKTGQVMNPTPLLHNLLEGEILYAIEPGQELVFCGYEDLQEKEKKAVGAFFAKSRIPARLRKIFPFIRNNDGFICFQFCSENKFVENEIKSFLNIKLEKISN